MTSKILWITLFSGVFLSGANMVSARALAKITKCQTTESYPAPPSSRSSVTGFHLSDTDPGLGLAGPQRPRALSGLLNLTCAGLWAHSPKLNRNRWTLTNIPCFGFTLKISLVLLISLILSFYLYACVWLCVCEYVYLWVCVSVCVLNFGTEVHENVY